MATKAECAEAEQGASFGVPCAVGFLLVIAEAAVARVVGPGARIGLASAAPG